MEQCSYLKRSRSADILKLGSTVAIGAVGSSLAVTGAGDGTVLSNHVGMLTTWTQPRKPYGELAQSRRFQLPMVDGRLTEKSETVC